MGDLEPQPLWRASTQGNGAADAAARGGRVVLTTDWTGTLPPFASLPPAVQSHLQREAHQIEQRRHAGYRRGVRRAVVTLIRSAYVTEAALRGLQGRVRQRRVGRWLLAAARGARATGRAAALAYERAVYRLAARRPVRPSPDERWRLPLASLGEPDRLLSYVEGIPMVAGTEACRRDVSINHVVATLLGFDLLRSNNQMVFLEANINPSLRPARAELYREDDPMWSRLLVYCEAHRLRRVVVYGYRPFSASHRRSLERQGRRQGIEVRVIDDVFAPGVGERAYFMTDHGPDTLVVRSKYFRTFWDTVVTNKRLTQELMTWWNRRAPAAEQVRIAPLLRPEDIAATYDPASTVPNLVLKEINADRGHGIHFVKAAQMPLAGLSPQVIVQQFVAPDTVDRRFLEDREEVLTAPGARHVRIFRTHVLLTPGEPVFLSGHTVTSLTTLPDAPLADGPIGDGSQFMANFSAGAVYGLVTAAEEEWCRDACVRAGRALLAWVQLKYQVR